MMRTLELCTVMLVWLAGCATAPPQMIRETRVIVAPAPPAYVVDPAPQVLDRYVYTQPPAIIYQRTAPPYLDARPQVITVPVPVRQVVYSDRGYDNDPLITAHRTLDVIDHGLQVYSLYEGVKSQRAWRKNWNPHRSSRCWNPSGTRAHDIGGGRRCYVRR